MDIFRDYIKQSNSWLVNISTELWGMEQMILVHDH